MLFTLGSAYDEFGYNEHAATTPLFLCTEINIIFFKVPLQ